MDYAFIISYCITVYNCIFPYFRTRHKLATFQKVVCYMGRNKLVTFSKVFLSEGSSMNKPYLSRLAKNIAYSAFL